jgi:hypothetical protein
MGGEKLDHGESGYLVYLAFKKALSRHIPLGKLWMPIYGWLADSCAQRSGRGRPDVNVDVRKYLPVKNEAWNKHVSQNGGDIVNNFLTRHPEYSVNTEHFITVFDGD